MSLAQLYYTSCDHGLSGYAGFQFNAVSAGVDARVMRDVEALTSYQRPTVVATGQEPINLCHAVDPATGTAVTAQVVYAGVDPSGRPGNYFAHALATADPERDLADLRPVELWRSTVWHTEPSPGTELPALADRPEVGPLDRVTVAEHLAAYDGATDVLGRLLTAAVHAGAGGRPVVLRNATVEENTLWIAAVSYLLDGPAALNLSFATYARRADRCRVSLIGTVPDPESDAVTAGLHGSYAVFDMMDRRHSDVDPHPAALLLAAAGPVRAAGLWGQARQLATGAQQSLDDWYPILAAVHAMTGQEPPLSAGAVDVVADWLVDAATRCAAPLSARRSGAVLRVVLERAEELSSERLRAFVTVAGAAEGEDQTAVIETALLDRALATLRSGSVPEPVTDPFTAHGRAAAADRAGSLLDSADADRAVDVLFWARRAGVSVASDVLRRCGQKVLGPAMERVQHDPRTVEVCRGQRALLSGMAANLAKGTQKRAVALLRGPVGVLLDAADLRSYPQLREFIVLEEVHKGGVAPLDAVRELVELRPPDAHPFTDAKLLRTLWPQGTWTAAETGRLLDHFNDLDSTAPAVSWLEHSLDPPSDAEGLDQWLKLLSAVRAHRAAFAALPAAVRDRISELDGLDEKLRAGAAAASRGDPEWYVELEKIIRGLSPMVHKTLWSRLATLIIRSPHPGRALADCPDPVFNACCVQAAGDLQAQPRSHDLGARLVAATSVLRPSPSRYQSFGRDRVAPALMTWTKRDRRKVRRQLRGGSVLVHLIGGPKPEDKAALETFDRLVAARDPGRARRHRWWLA